MKSWFALLTIAGAVALAGCGGSQHSGGAFAGNWQYTMAAPVDNSFVGGIQGGFLQQNGNALTGEVVYSVARPQPNAVPIVCNSGSAAVTGTINGQNVTLTASAGGQTFTLTGALSQDGSTMAGTYTSTAGTPVGGTACGTAQSGVQWSALSVPVLNGAVQGSFHSKMNNQDFPVAGVLSQGENVGASSATVTGTLTFQGNSCLGGSAHQTVTVNGEISGNSILLQVFADSGLNIGEIGQSLGLNPQGAPVVFESLAPGGYVAHNTTGIGYSLTTKACPTESGNVCLAMGQGTGCTEPITLSPASLSFPAQLVGSASTTQTITLTNTDPAGSTLSGLSLQWNAEGLNGFSDFSGWPNFLELDSCASPPGSTFTLQPNQSCTITVFFSPQQSCPWLPNAGVAPAQCPPFIATTLPAAIVTVNSSTSADGDKVFAVPITGVGLSEVVPSTPELDFGAEAMGESSPPQTLAFTNQGTFPVQILKAASPSNACSANPVTLSRPLQAGDADGLRVVQDCRKGYTSTAQVPCLQAYTPTNGRPTVQYSCDYDPSGTGANKSNFQLGSDTCTGALLQPGDTCAVNIAYVPQPATNAAPGLDYFLELNTQGCTGNSVGSDCEIDSGRFPVELKANSAGPLRMSPGAGLDFGTQAKSTSSVPLTITLFNDPQDPNAGTVDFQGKATPNPTASGNYTETDNCGASLAPGSSCTLSFVFAPQSTGFEQETMTITYTVPASPALSAAQVQTITLRGTGQ